VARKKSGRHEPELDSGTADSVMEPVQEKPEAIGFPIVGIGASAGGLATFEAFFSGMPADTDPGMAFVLVQHLAPDHKSILTDIIRRYTRMTVCEVEDGMVIQPNCTYIIPPNRDMAFLGGALQLFEPTAPRGQRMPIDYFFSSLAQDLRERAIAKARTGVYPDSIAATIPAEKLTRFFSAEPGGNSYRVNKNIRDLVVFSVQDVIRDPPFSRIDLISCRNLLIYMSAELQKKLIPLFHYSLKPGGFLFLGTSESLGDHDSLYTVKDRKQKIYQRKEDPYNAQRLLPDKVLPTAFNLDIKQKPATGLAIVANRLPLQELTERALLQEVAPAAALVDGNGDILYLHGRTGLYLEPQPGVSGTSNILKMAREGLQRDLAIALRKAAISQKAAGCTRLQVKTNGDFTAVNLTVRPVVQNRSEIAGERLYLVILEQSPLASRLRPAHRTIYAGIHLHHQPHPERYGRPLAHIVYNLKGYDHLHADTRTVLDTLSPKEIEVQTNDGAWHLMRILPYRTLENVIEGAVLTFVDISAAKKAQTSLLEARN
jgi:hypothetical protein